MAYKNIQITQYLDKLQSSIIEFYDEISSYDAKNFTLYEKYIHNKKSVSVCCLT
jgi:hypothetical protein